MKKLNYLLMLGCAAAFIFTSCDKNEENNDPSAVIDFEAAQLAATSTSADGYTNYTNILWGAEKAQEVNGVKTFDGILYSEDGTSFGSYYTVGSYEYEGATFTYDVWNGFAISGNHTTKADYMDVSNQFRVHAVGGGKFAVGFVAIDYQGNVTAMPTMTFSKAETVLSIDFANSDEAYKWVTEKEYENTDYLRVIVTGHKGSAQTGKVTVDLFKNGNAVADWKSFDFSSLGAVDKLTFLVEFSDAMMPAYFCIDNITLK